jgi:Tfp pilus assembly protein PilX
MNLFPAHVSRFTRPRRRQAGSAVIVVMALLAIILIYVAGNLRTLSNLGRELRLLERQQTRRLQTANATTNSPTATLTGTNSVPRSPAN